MFFYFILSYMNWDYGCNKIQRNLSLKKIIDCDFRVFKYLGFLMRRVIGYLLRGIFLLNLIIRRFNLWRHRYVSLGGRVLLNFVSNVIHMSFLSFLKMFVKVWKKNVKIQRRLYGVELDQILISFELGGLMCKSKKFGGLGVCDLRLVNQHC